jgi:2-iminobutanoate/2-iminopropanoate deaminase
MLLDNIHKSYHQRLVLNHIQMALYSGDAVALTGVNGSGKSTLLRIAAGLVRPDRGGIRKLTLGKELIIGYVPERFSPLRFTAEEYLFHMGRIAGISTLELNRRITTLLHLFDMVEGGQRRMATYSKGMLQKTNIMQALLNSPTLLILDEPLSGLDDHSVQEIIRILVDLKKEGVTLLFAVHERLLIEAIANREIQLVKGSLVEYPFENREDQAERRGGIRMTRLAYQAAGAVSVGPYSHAVESGASIYFSGQTPIDALTGKLIEGDVAAQTEQCFNNLFSVLRETGLSKDEIVKVNVYLTDMNDFSMMNSVYERQFDKPYPARTTIGVAALPLGARVEIEMIANRRL